MSFVRTPHSIASSNAVLGSRIVVFMSYPLPVEFFICSHDTRVITYLSNGFDALFLGIAKIGP